MPGFLDLFKGVTTGVKASDRPSIDSSPSQNLRSEYFGAVNRSDSLGSEEFWGAFNSVQKMIVRLCDQPNRNNPLMDNPSVRNFLLKSIQTVLNTAEDQGLHNSNLKASLRSFCEMLPNVDVRVVGATLNAMDSFYNTYGAERAAQQHKHNTWLNFIRRAQSGSNTYSPIR